jgi:hypothetical protein
VACFAFESDVAAVSFDGPASDGQSKASTTPLSGPRLIDAVKAVEDMRLMFVRNSRSLVDHVQEHLFASPALYPDEDLASLG